jgi:hypothetical protein
MTAQDLADLLHAQQVEPGQWQAHCLGHIDTLPSLTIREGRAGRVLLSCDANCSREEMLRAFGLDEDDLSVSAPIALQARIRESLKARSKAERYWRKARRRRLNRLATHEATVAALLTKRARVQADDELAQLLRDARIYLQQAERETEWINRPFKAKRWRPANGRW